MKISTTSALSGGRAHFAIGQVKATTGWRAAEDVVSEQDREIATRALSREAEEYGADALVDVSFSVEECRDCEIQGVKLRRVTATGTAVRFAMAA
jgi:uncharacterized protein YbjQ (UPF0145 family)